MLFSNQDFFPSHVVFDFSLDFKVPQKKRVTDSTFVPLPNSFRTVPVLPALPEILFPQNKTFVVVATAGPGQPAEQRNALLRIEFADLIKDQHVNVVGVDLEQIVGGDRAWLGF